LELPTWIYHQTTYLPFIGVSGLLHKSYHKKQETWEVLLELPTWIYHQTTYLPFIGVSALLHKSHHKKQETWEVLLELPTWIYHQTTFTPQLSTGLLTLITSVRPTHMLSLPVTAKTVPKRDWLLVKFHV